MSTSTPNAPIRWGILATGRIAQQFAQGLKALPDATLQAVGSRDEASAKRFAAIVGARTAHASYEALVADPEVDILYVATPHSRHAADCTLALGAGKPVLCEKPFAINATQADQVIALARSRKLFCMEAMWMRFIPLVLQVRDLVRSGEIGEPRLLTADFGYAVAPDPRDRLFDPARAGGCLLDRGVYPLALAQLLFGVPDSVSGHATKAATGVDDTIAITLGYKDGPVALLGSSLTATTRNEAVIVGTDGSITVHAPFYHPSRVTITHRSPAAPWVEPGSIAAPGLKQRLVAAAKGSVVGQRLLASGLLQRGKSRVLNQPDTANGYHHEAAETMRCLRAGLTESPLMPLDASRDLLRITDQLRRDWGVAYPGEDG